MSLVFGLLLTSLVFNSTTAMLLAKQETFNLFSVIHVFKIFHRRFYERTLSTAMQSQKDYNVKKEL